MADPFNIGDLVQLKSGGPVMNIDRFYENEAHAVWFAYGKRRSDFFAPQALKAADGVEEKGRVGNMIGA